jgi:hypothetical protein
VPLQARHAKSTLSRYRETGIIIHRFGKTSESAVAATVPGGMLQREIALGLSRSKETIDSICFN